MQLIFDSASDTDIGKNMDFIEKDSINEKFSTENLIQKLSNNDSSNSNKENIEENDAVLLKNGSVENLLTIALKSANEENIKSQSIVKDEDDSQQSSQQLKDVTRNKSDDCSNGKCIKENQSTENKIQSPEFGNQDDLNLGHNERLEDIQDKEEIRDTSATETNKEVGLINSNQDSKPRKNEDPSANNSDIEVLPRVKNNVENEDSKVSKETIINNEEHCSEIEKEPSSLNESKTEVPLEVINTEEKINNAESQILQASKISNESVDSEIEKKSSAELISQNIPEEHNKLFVNGSPLQDVNSESEEKIIENIEQCESDTQVKNIKEEITTLENDIDGKDKQPTSNEKELKHDVDGTGINLKGCNDVENLQTGGHQINKNPENDSLKKIETAEILNKAEETASDRLIIRKTKYDNSTIEINDDSSQENDIHVKNEDNLNPETVKNTSLTGTNEKSCNIDKNKDEVQSQTNEMDVETTDDREDNSNKLKLKDLAMLTKNHEENSVNKQSEGNEINEQKKQKTSFKSKLSNTLDILSEDEDANDEKETNKQCINLDDDDDIMLIDDEPSNKVDIKENVKESSKIEETIEEKSESSTESKTDINEAVDKCEKIDGDDSDKPTETPEDTETQKASPHKPLLPTNFLSTCKKNLSDMTRNELEEFCILKIVESVIDKGNLGEIKSQLKKMAASIEEHKNKAKLLSKQNQELQVVLRSLNEEFKKNLPITPLKITRSVGIQNLMSEKAKRKVPQQTNTTPTSQANKTQAKSPTGPATRLQKQVNTPQQIPVPRLIPAKSSNTAVPSPTKPQNVATPARTPVQKPEKRTFSKSQTSGSDTVDLTDDEPSPKLLARLNANQTVRVVPPQNLMARPPLGSNPRQVYIPIGSGQPANIRPNLAVRPGVRQRLPMRRLHPAPLPENTKQYQAPNWKAIPPAPEIKLSKVENGIVISWKLDNYREDIHEVIASYQIYAYQETSAPPNTSLWKKIGDVKALPLPMACTLTQFVPGFKYYFAVRAVDVRSRQGVFSLPGNIMLLNR